MSDQRRICIVSSKEYIRDRASYAGTIARYWLGGTFKDRQRVERDSGLPFDQTEFASGLFHNVFDRNFEKFLEVFDQLEGQNHTPEYWSTAISSKSSSSEPIVRDLTLLLSATQLVSSATGSVVLVTDTAALGALLSQIYDPLSAAGWRWRQRRTLLKLGIKSLAKHGVFMLQSLQALFQKRSAAIDFLPKKTILLRTWVTQGVVRRKGDDLQFSDRNFGSLRDQLREQDFDVLLLPMFFNLGGGESEILRDLRAAGCKVLDVFSMLSLLDVFKVAWRGLKAIRLRTSGLKLIVDGRSFDISGVVKESHLRTHGAPDLLRLQLDDAVLAKLSESVSLAGIIYPFENNSSEKTFLLAARSAFPRADLIGFQHTVVFRDQLSMRLSASDLGVHPLPDRIVCSGPIYPRVLQKLGFPQGILRIGANLRYAGIEQTEKWNPARASSILYVMSYNENHVAEVLLRLGVVLNQLRSEVPDLVLRLKLHPLIKRDKVSELVLHAGLEAMVEYTERPVVDCVRESQVTVMTGASVSNLEALAIGAPLILVSLAQDFDFECLWPEFHPDASLLAPIARTEGDLLESLRSAFHRVRQGDSLATQAGDITEAYFLRPQKAQLSSFLPSNGEVSGEIPGRIPPQSVGLKI